MYQHFKTIIHLWGVLGVVFLVPVVQATSIVAITAGWEQTFSYASG